MGSSLVDVHSLAIHGSSGRGVVAKAGTVTADAVGQGLGLVSATATANALKSGNPSLARAEATGSSGTALAESLSGNDRFSYMAAFSEAPVVSSAVAKTSAAVTGALPGVTLDGTSDAFSYLTATAPGQEVWGRVALGLLDRQGLDDDDIVLRSGAVFSQSLFDWSVGPDLFVSFLSVETGSEEFQELRFQIKNGSTALVDEIFTEMEEAEEFFQGTLHLEIAPISLSGVSLEFVMELESGGVGSGFAATFALGAVPIPEPSTGSLLMVGIVLLAMRRVRRRSGRIF